MQWSENAVRYGEKNVRFNSIGKKKRITYDFDIDLYKQRIPSIAVYINENRFILNRNDIVSCDISIDMLSIKEATLKLKAVDTDSIIDIGNIVSFGWEQSTMNYDPYYKNAVGIVTSVTQVKNIYIYTIKGLSLYLKDIVFDSVGGVTKKTISFSITTLLDRINEYIPIKDIRFEDNYTDNLTDILPPKKSTSIRTKSNTNVYELCNLFTIKYQLYILNRNSSVPIDDIESTWSIMESKPFKTSELGLYIVFYVYTVNNPVHINKSFNARSNVFIDNKKEITKDVVNEIILKNKNNEIIIGSAGANEVKESISSQKAFGKKTKTIQINESDSLSPYIPTVKNILRTTAYPQFIYDITAIKNENDYNLFFDKIFTIYNVKDKIEYTIFDAGISFTNSEYPNTIFIYLTSFREGTVTLTYFLPYLLQSFVPYKGIVIKIDTRVDATDDRLTRFETPGFRNIGYRLHAISLQPEDDSENVKYIKVFYNNGTLHNTVLQTIKATWTANGWHFYNGTIGVTTKKDIDSFLKTVVTNNNFNI